MLIIISENDFYSILVNSVSGNFKWSKYRHLRQSTHPYSGRRQGRRIQTVCTLYKTACLLVKHTPDNEVKRYLNHVGEFVLQIDQV
jgi:hypothetical protein